MKYDPTGLAPDTAPGPAGPNGALPDEMTDALREHLGVCNALLELARKEAQALKSPAPFPAMAIQVERKALLCRLEYALKLLGQKRNLWNCSGKERAPGDPRFTRLLRTALDTIMRVLVLDRENEQQLLRRGLLPACCLPPAEQSRPHYVARLYQRHAQT
ncbi:MAG: hypothetical protein ABSH34_35425 [Verrucomicrobiota bacterium]|jgi:hypothetical protein